MNNDTNKDISPLTTPENTPSFRSSSREELSSKKVAVGGEFSDFKENDSSPIQGDAFGAAADKKINSAASEESEVKPSKTEPEKSKRHGSRQRTSREQLVRIEARLSARDHAVLQAIRKYRFLTSDQIGRLYVRDCSTKNSRTRQTQLLTKRLSGLSLIWPFERRVGGSGGGSTMQVWHLTNAGYRLLALNDPGGKIRKSFQEPSALFMHHTLVIAECAVQMIEIARTSVDVNIDTIETEPDCWRRFRDDDFRVYNLKPDMFAITTNVSNEDRYFLEIDLATESSEQIIQKCNMYLHYYYTGVEQRENEVFPLVVWIVPDEKRREQLNRAISETFKTHPKLFMVITPGSIEQLLREEYTVKDMC